MLGTLDLEVVSQPLYTLVTVTGGLHLGSYRRLRDGLLEVAADEPEAVIAGIDGLDLDAVAPVGVFGLVARRLGTWPGIPFALAGTASRTRALREQGIHRQVAIGEDVGSAERALCKPSRQQTELVLPAASKRRRWRGPRCGRRVRGGRYRSSSTTASSSPASSRPTRPSTPLPRRR
ncbi:hypothetical protein [Amycolatopsis sp. RTGN1]|uniref:hypothetical protein n=1 Tax=Amycolatopsis ponsaeliensis TaxID=2992142 RepID=UPI00254E46F9|nr:hypothetical protein [Amycolatopsis sp. RTGN1]